MKTPHVKLVLAMVVGLSVGIFAGVIYARHTIGMSFGWMSQWAAIDKYVQLADFQYQYADETHARESLSDFLNFTQKLKGAGNVTDPKALELSVASAYIRLAALDQHAGNSDGYQSNFSRAQEALKAAGAKEASAETMDRVVNQRKSW